MANINYNLEEFTSDILIQNDMYKIPVDLIKIANNNNIEVYKSEVEEKISGAIKYYKKEDKFIILLNEKDSEFRRRFTLAHELGHYFLHKDILKSDEIHVDTLYRMPSEKEREVDYFAGALLINKKLLEKMYLKTTSISALSQIFEVSESAMTVRLDILGML